MAFLGNSNFEEIYKIFKVTSLIERIVNDGVHFIVSSFRYIDFFSIEVA